MISDKHRYFVGYFRNQEHDNEKIVKVTASLPELIGEISKWDKAICCWEVWDNKEFVVASKRCDGGKRVEAI